MSAGPQAQEGPATRVEPGGPRALGVGAASLDLGLRMTLLAVLLDPPLLWFERLPPMLLAGLGLAVPATLRARWLWAGLLVAATWPLVLDWPFSDNHDYLVGALVPRGRLRARERATRRAPLAHQARRLLGLTLPLRDALEGRPLAGLRRRALLPA